MFFLRSWLKSLGAVGDNTQQRRLHKKIEGKANKGEKREGEKQVRRYEDQLEKQTGRKFKTVVDTYDIMPDGTIKYNYGTPK